MAAPRPTVARASQGGTGASVKRGHGCAARIVQEASRFIGVGGLSKLSDLIGRAIS